MNESLLKKRYHRWLCGLILVLLLTTIISLTTGKMNIQLAELGQALLGQASSQTLLILTEFRLPRIVIAILVGFALAIAGAVLQSTTQNPMADTGFLGINSGAGIVVMLVVAFGKLQGDQILLLPALALLGALGSAALVFACAYQKGRGITPTRLLLTGVALSSCFSALMVLLTLKLSPENYQFVMTWLTGSIWGTSWTFIWALIPWLIILLPFIFSKMRILDAFTLGDDLTTALGISLQKERFMLIGAAAILAGTSVSISGGIGFIGLIAPHMARKIIGSRHRYQLMLTGCLGSTLLLVADTLGKVISPTAEIPAGVLVAIIGAPYFIYLLLTAKQ